MSNVGKNCRTANILRMKLKMKTVNTVKHCIKVLFCKEVMYCHDTQMNRHCYGKRKSFTLTANILRQVSCSKIY